MTYRGRPSKGCERCRARKVKCDEQKPCSRCSKLEYDCKYRDPADLLFRNQTASAAQKAEESWRKRSKSNQRAPSESSTSNKSPPSDNSSTLSSGYYDLTSGNQNSRQSSPPRLLGGGESMPNLSSLSIAPEVQSDLLRLAHERFVYDFVIPESPNRPPEEASDAFWTFIPLLYQKAAKDSCLGTVVDAVAYANFANRCNAPQAEALAEECLGKSINLLSKAIVDKKLAASDETLLSVYMMGTYENFTMQQRKGTYLAHIQGANALLQLRSIEQYYSDPVSARIYEVTYAQMLLGNLQAGRRPPLPMKNVVPADKSLPDRLYKSPNNALSRLVWREAMLHAKWYEVKQSNDLPASRQDLHELLKSALDLDNEFQAWEAITAPAWRYQMEPNTPGNRSTYDVKWQKLILGSRGAPEEIHYYSNLKRCWIWGYYRASRIFLLRDLLEILNWMSNLPEPDSLIGSRDELAGASTPPNKPRPTGLDDVALRIHHSFATVNLVNIIEKACSSILGYFTVPIHSRSFENVVGMRGYICLWGLTKMDAALKSGLVPNSNSNNLSNTGYPPQISPFSHAQNTDLPPNLRFISEAHLHHQPGSLPPSEVPSDTPLITTSGFGATARKGHINDSRPPHPYDHPFKIPTIGFNITKPKTIDVAARREWLNRIMYYIGSELGIKKALLVPIMEGFIETVKPSVDSVTGR